jgi:alcohol dehydrogenase (cytochrome c)
MINCKMSQLTLIHYVGNRKTHLMNRLWIFLIFLVTGLSADWIWSNVFYEQLLRAMHEPNNWLTYSGNYFGWRYSPLSQINITNVQNLSVQWLFQVEASGRFETTPLVIDGIMYVTGLDNRGFALNARTGQVIWRYQRPLPDTIFGCCGRVNRGFAAFGNKVFMATLDAHVVALDAKTGNVIWDVKAEDYRHGYGFTLAPLIVKDKVIVGISGGDFGIRGFIEAYEVETGKRVWRFSTIPVSGEPGNETWEGDSWKTGGAAAWLTGTYDPGLNLVYWGTGNPGPDLYGQEREGDNLYSNCVVALDPDTGELKWHFQFTPHDTHDWDATQIPMLLDLKFRGQPRKLLAMANRNGFFYLLDRTNGQFLLGKPFARTTWAKEIRPDGRPAVLPNPDPTPGGNLVCPGAVGATNWMSPSYNPQVGLFYVAVREQCDKYFSSPQPHKDGQLYFGSAAQAVPGDKGWGALRALNPSSGDIRWEFRYYSAPLSGTLSTGGRLVFASNLEGYFIAFDAQTGRQLWHLQTGFGIYASPMTYYVEGKQYVTIPSGSTLIALALPDSVLSKSTSAGR